MVPTRLLYFSENTIGKSGGALLAELRTILATSIRNNEAAGITGALVFDDDFFLQALEGDRDQVWKTLKRIEDDERHVNVTIIDARQTDDRLFANWWMGLARRDDQTEAVFAPHLKNGRWQPKDMTSTDVVEMMTALAKSGLSRRLAAAA